MSVSTLEWVEDEGETDQGDAFQYDVARRSTTVMGLVWLDMIVKSSPSRANLKRAMLYFILMSRLVKCEEV